MKKKEIKKTKMKPRSKAETKENQFGVILEDVRHQFGIMSEGFSGMNKRFDELNEKVDNNHKEFREFRSETNSNFKTIFNYLSKIDDELQAIKTEIADLKVKLENKADSSRLTSVERKMFVMQKQIDAMVF